MANSTMENLIGRRLLARNMILSLFGQGAPLLVGIITIPLLVEELGTSRFGILTIAWLIVGYAGVFDFGLGRALTQAIAVRLGDDRVQEVPILAQTAIVVMAALGALAAFIGVLTAPRLVGEVLHLPQNLERETLDTLYLVALSLPAVIVTTGLRGILEAYQRFGLAAALRLPMGLFNFLAPVAVLPFSTDLSYIVGVLIIGRFFIMFAHIGACIYVVPRLIRSFGFATEHSKALLNFGGWLTVSNLIAPLMLYLDRFVIVGTLPVTAMAYYSTPYEIITKLWVVPTALLAVMFPAFTTSFVSDRARTVELYRQSMRWILFLLLPVVVAIVLFARTGLEVWLDIEFASNSFRIAQVLAIGVLLHSLAMSPATLIQAVGRPSLAAKLHLFQLPLYVGLLWWLTTAYGPVGAALCWALRAGVALLLMAFVAKKIVLTPEPDAKRSLM